MKLTKKNIVHLLTLGAIYIVFVLALTRFRYAYGSELDWGGQHYAIPDYFRKLFYETGELFPSFAPNIGAGENIYNFSYYGLFSPIILFSYLLPFVKMSVYIQAVSILGIMISTFIFYRWMCSKFEENTAFMLSLAFMMSGPLIFHSHRHIMFVSYMPFLLLSFKSAEDYMNGKKKYKLVIFTFLMIMTCYFYALSGICALTVYSVYCYLKKNDKIVPKHFLRTGFHYAGRILTAVLMSGVLILPTAYCMLNGRDKNNVSIDLSVFLPTVKLKFATFATYSMGLGVFFFFAAAAAITSKIKHRRFLGVTMALILIFPVFILLLNGGLYIDSKALIPFMPLGVMMIGETYIDILNNKSNCKIPLAVTAVYVLCAMLINGNSTYVRIFSVVDLFIITICLAVYSKSNKRVFLNFAILVCTIVSTVCLNFKDKLVPLDEIKTYDGEAVYSLAETAENNSEFVRTCNFIHTVNTANMVYNGGYYSATIYSSLHNKLYNNFYFNEIYNENEYRNSALTTASKNILWNIYMSQKYIISDQEISICGYEKAGEADGIILYENDNVFPIGYADSHIMSRREYEKLEYPYSLDALMRYTIVETDADDVYKPRVREVSPVKFSSGKTLKCADDGYIVDSQEEFSLKFVLPEAIDDSKILLISFDVDNTVGIKDDVCISINDQKNTLTDPNWKYYNGNTTFQYAVTCGASDNISCSEICFGKGNYKISNVKCYVMDNDFVRKDGFSADMDKTTGDVICGTVDASENGYLNMSIPYSDGFSITVNGEKIQYELVDTAFIGFAVNKGVNRIEIRFKAPLLNEGKFTSVVGSLILIILIIYEYFENNKRKVRQKN